MDPGRDLVREPDISSPRQYRRRLRQLAVIYPLLIGFALAGLGLIVWNGRLLVSLTQKSNVETLTLVFFLLFFSYLVVLSARGAHGAALLAVHHLRGWLSGNRRSAQRALVHALGPRQDGPAVALSHVLERADNPGRPFEIAVEDDVGSVGHIFVDGVTVRHVDGFKHGSNSMLAFFVRQVCEVLELDPNELDVVSWRNIDAEGFHQYVGMVTALKALGRRGSAVTATWPRRSLTAENVREIKRRMSEICVAVREEALLPRVEYEGEHKIPIIPEPLGMISLKRRERRVDQLTSMASFLAIVVIVTGLLLWFVLRPPSLPE
jgi:hypothetical protein